MISAFENYLRNQTQLSETEISRISSFAIYRRLRRKESLLASGEICRYKTFIINGLLRTYSSSVEGNETILQFSPELTWSLDAESYDQQLPSRYNIAAVEISEVLLWHKSDFDLLLSELPGLKNYAEQLISRNIYSGRQRLLTALSSSPEEKYEEFAANSPALLSRLPLRMIASYLGMSIKTLTRLRNAQWTR